MLKSLQKHFESTFGILYKAISNPFQEMSSHHHHQFKVIPRTASELSRGQNHRDMPIYL